MSVARPSHCSASVREKRAHTFRPWTQLTLLLTAFALWPRALAAAPVPWTLLESSGERVVLAVQVPEPEWVVEESTGGGRLQLAGFPGWGVAQGRIVPALDLRVALPPDADPAVRVEALDLAPLGHALAELPADDGPAAAQEDRESADPAGYVRVGRPYWAATQRLLDLRVQPVAPDARGRIQSPRILRITVEFSVLAAGDGTRSESRAQGRARVAGPAREDPWRKLLDRLVVNPASAATWSRPATSAPPSGPSAEVGAPGTGRLSQGPGAGLTGRGDSFGSAPDWVRIEIGQRGLYVITADDLARLGYQPALVGLADLRLFCADAGELPENELVENLPAWMEPCALWVVDDGDGAWDEETRVYFLGNGPDGWRDDLGLAAQAQDPYYQHPYARTFTYWLTWGGTFSTDPLWMEEREAQPQSGAVERTTAHARIHLEQNRIYDPRPRLAALPWERFLWLDLAGVPSTVDFTLPDVVIGTQAELRLSAWGKNLIMDGFDDHNLLVEAQIGSPLTAPRITLGTIVWQAYQRGLLDAQFAADASQVRVWMTVPARQNAQGEPLADGSYLACMECQYERDLVMRGDSLAFFVTADEAAGSRYVISGLASAEGWLLLDASDPRAPVRLVPAYTERGGMQAAEFSVTPAGESARLVMLKLADAAAPADLTLPHWNTPLLRDRTEAIDYLIVAPRAFDQASAHLAAHRATRYYGAGGDSAQPARVAVVDIQQIFDEFGGGQRDPAALRNFVRYAWLHWNGGASWQTLTHLMLLGNAHYDPRGYLGLNATDYVPGYLYFNFALVNDPSWRPEHFGDDWFGMLDGPGDAGLDLALGRLPVMSAAEAMDVVQKIVRYDVDPPQGPWRERILMAADDICQSYEPDELSWLHLRQTEAMVKESVPPDANTIKLYMIEYGSQCIYDRKPDAARDLMDQLDDGVLWFNYVGHGSETQLADERLLETATLGSLANGERLFFFLTASCAVGKFAHGGDGVGVAAARMADGGAVAVVSASGLASSFANAELNERVFAAVFPWGTVLRPAALGPALWSGKTSEYNDRRYNLLGDPATRLATPKLGISLALEQGGAAVADTLRRGMVTMLRGEVIDELGRPVSDFEGDVTLEVYDSDIQRHPTAQSIDDYRLRGARIFTADLSAAGGAFSEEFFMPTALRSGERGPARIYAFATQTGEEAEDAAGSLQQLFIRADTSGAVTDTDPPQIELAWENPGSSPQAGSRVFATLTDASGLYVAALTPSRAVVVSILDEDDRYLVASDVSAQVTFGADFRLGRLVYALPEGLPGGVPLRLVLSASDNVMNRHSAELEFQLGTDGGGRLLEQVYAMPNPVDAETHFLFELARSADLEVTIYTATGRAIRHLNEQEVSRERARRIGLQWDARDDDGDPLGNGVYFYRAVARDPSGGRDERIERLVVFRQAP